jgi:hypothetical protein
MMCVNVYVCELVNNFVYILVLCFLSVVVGICFSLNCFIYNEMRVVFLSCL